MNSLRPRKSYRISKILTRCRSLVRTHKPRSRQFSFGRLPLVSSSLFDGSQPREKSSKLPEFRKGINAIDREIARLLAKRCGIAREVGKEKRRLGLPILNMAREQEIFHRIGDFASANGLDERMIKRVFADIIALCKTQER